MTMTEEKKEYELSFLVNAAEGEAAVSSVLKEYKAEVFYKSPLNEVRFEYPIKKYKQGYFGFVHFQGEPESIAKILQSLKLQPNILRVLVVTPPVGKVERGGKASRPRALKPEVTAAPVPSSGGVLSNEALEQKLEEILK